MKKHKISFRVYYEDTDSGGVVYYANYLKFAERARTEMLREAGINQSEKNILFVVKKVKMNLIKPAKLDDMITVESSIKKLSGASMGIEQIISRDEIIISEISVLIVCVNKNFKPTKIPSEIRENLNDLG